MMERNRVNLRMHYRSLQTGRQEFLRKVADRCDVSLNAVRGWVNFDSKTQNPERLKVLSEETGISVDDLFNKELEHEYA